MAKGTKKGKNTPALPKAEIYKHPEADSPLRPGEGIQRCRAGKRSASRLLPCFSDSEHRTQDSELFFRKAVPAISFGVSG